MIRDLAFVARALAIEVTDELLERVRRHPVLGEIYELADGVVGDFVRDHGPMYAGALAFYAILSLIPLVVVFAWLSVLLFAGGDGDTDAALRETLVQLKKIIPYLDPAFENDMRTILKNRNSLGIAGAFGVLVSASQVFRAVEFSLARIFSRVDHEGPTDEKARPRNFISSKLVFGVVVTSTVLSFLALRLFAGVLRHVSEFLRLPPSVVTLLEDPLSGATGLGQLLTTVAIVFGFVVLLKVFAHVTVPFRFALLGGVCFAGAFHAAHRVYDIYLERLTNIGAVYGSFATLIIIILWIYFTSILLLLCGHLTKTVQRRATAGPRWPKDTWFGRPKPQRGAPVSGA
jgi:membrane protein